MARRSYRFKFTIAILALALLLVLTHGVWLAWLGEALVYDQAPIKADVAVVLAGDSWGNRLVRGAELVKQGYASRILVSGPPSLYGVNESDLAIAYGVRQGYPAEWFVPVNHDARSTLDEATALLNYMRQHEVHSFLLVTSNYHSARSHRIFVHAEKERGGGPSFRTVAARDQDFTPDGWWHSREGRKTAFMEWTKTVANLLRI